MAIRVEFSHLSDEDFINGQKMFFNKVLNQKKIYEDDNLNKLFELTARKNLKKALEEF